MNLLTRQNNTNNYSEASIRILKDVVLSRTKAFNVVALTEFCISVWEDYLKQKLIDFANSRRDKVELLYKSFCKKIQGMTEEDILEENGLIVKMSSQSNKNITYVINMDVGYCTCAAGISGAFCKHQFFLMKTRNIGMPNAPPVTPEEKYSLAKLALGSKCPTFEFYSGFLEPAQSTSFQNENSPGPSDDIKNFECLSSTPIEIEEMASEEDKIKIFREIERISGLLNMDFLKKAADSAINTLRKIKKTR